MSQPRVDVRILVKLFMDEEKDGAQIAILLKREGHPPDEIKQVLANYGFDPQLLVNLVQHLP